MAERADRAVKVRLPHSEADVRRIFGHGGYRIVNDPARLATALARTYAELLEGR